MVLLVIIIQITCSGLIQTHLRIKISQFYTKVTKMEMISIKLLLLELLIHHLTLCTIWRIILFTILDSIKMSIRYILMMMIRKDLCWFLEDLKQLLILFSIERISSFLIQIREYIKFIGVMIKKKIMRRISIRFNWLLMLLE